MNAPPIIPNSSPTRTLSSVLTFFMKFLFTSIWISGFGFFTVMVWVHTVDPSGLPDNRRWQFLTAWICGSLFILWGCAGLKRVRVDERMLYISNFRKEIPVPLSAVESVTENTWINIRPVTICFRVETAFGRTIKFMPEFRSLFLSPWTSHPVVDELRRAAGLG
jgi:hypothetical protein